MKLCIAYKNLKYDKIDITDWYLSNLKPEVDKSDVDKLTNVPVDLSKLSNVVKNDVVKKNCVWQVSC